MKKLMVCGLLVAILSPVGVALGADALHDAILKEGYVKEGEAYVKRFQNDLITERIGYDIKDKMFYFVVIFHELKIMVTQSYPIHDMDLLAKDLAGYIKKMRLKALLGVNKRLQERKQQQQKENPKDQKQAVWL